MYGYQGSLQAKKGKGDELASILLASSKVLANVKAVNNILFQETLLTQMKSMCMKSGRAKRIMIIH